MLKSIVSAVLIAVTLIHVSDGKILKIKPRTFISPYTLYDQAVEKLAKLKTVVDSALLTAHSDLDRVQTTHSIYAQGVYDTAEVEINDEAQKIEGYLTDMKDLADSLLTDIGICLRGREAHLDRLPGEAVNNLETCIGGINGKVRDKINEAKKAVDSNNEVIAVLNAQLKACVTGSIICLSPVVRDIDAATIEVPETIDKEVHSVSNNVGTVSLEVDECSSSVRSAYVTDANDVLADIEDCINRIT